MGMPWQRSTADLAGELWQAEVDYQSASEATWATGRPPSASLEGWHAASLGTKVSRLRARLARRAGESAAVPLSTLAELPESPPPDSVAAAAALRVFRSASMEADRMALQPGGELPAVGIYAEMAD